HSSRAPNMSLPALAAYTDTAPGGHGQPSAHDRSAIALVNSSAASSESSATTGGSRSTGRESDDHPFLSREIAMPRRFSETTAAAADKAVMQMLGKAEARSTEILQAHRL